MEFLLFLGSQEKEILELVYKANYSVEENTPLCLLGEKYFGFLKKDQKRIVICTENAKSHGGYNLSRSIGYQDDYKTGLMIRRAIRHESVHVAQECNNGNLLNLKNKKNAKISEQKLGALKGSVKLTGNLEKEYEAYLIEDQPRKVIAALKKYCF
ncbi:hypothetical protein [Prochlorococcus marinus]|uniref:Possible Serine hydroxymethyltransferase n=1 Tax=Prochlorococcus marinus (strain MIT 9211) TaxID=93059 RepID=A9B9X5_PROM4|nr:hypothetical protein [Prochlorococcus marinus]ABX08637.1 possible Serine hydroxymethyltransferase [Prochlorococcus marinus str. MIT 9211]